MNVEAIMGIWEYRENETYALGSDESRIVRTAFTPHTALLINNCPYCSSSLSTLGNKENYFGQKPLTSNVELRACQICGWWVIHRTDHYNWTTEGTRNIYRSAGILKRLDLTDIGTPRMELARYLLAKYDDRFILNPRKLEDIVGGVFYDFGYHVRVTSFSGDEGLDVIVLDGDRNDTIGVQVKRYSGKIEAEQIRSFVGALVLDRLTKGIFVTTSSFTKGANKTVQKYQERGYAVSLWDSDVFYDKLRIATRPAYKSTDELDGPFYKLWKDKELIPYVDGYAW